MYVGTKHRCISPVIARRTTDKRDFWLLFYLDRIQRFDGILASIICVNPVAMELARECDRSLRGAGRLSGSLHGVPVLLKDNIETKDMPTTAGSLSLEGFSTGKDADLVKRLKAAGAIILAKTNLHEFAIWGESISSIKGQTLNPYDLTRTPGGSSGGTGAALAANLGLVGIGTDTINSIRSHIQRQQSGRDPTYSRLGQR